MNNALWNRTENAQRVTHWAWWLAWGCLLWALADGARADSYEIKDMKFSVLPGNDVQVTLEFADKVPEPLSFTTSNPSRIVFDFPATRPSVAEKNLNIGIGAVQGVGLVEANSRARMVISLVRTEAYTTAVEGNRMIVSIGTAAKNQIATSPPPPVADAPPESAPPEPTTRQAMQDSPGSVFADTQATSQAEPIVREPHIQQIDFRRNRSGAGQIIITLSDPTTTVDMREEGKKIVVDFRDTVLPERLDRRLDVVDFATPVLTIDTKESGKDTHMEVSTTGKYEHLSYQTGNVYTIEVKQVAPEQKKEEIAIKDRQYTGEKISLNFQNIDIHAVLNLIADFRGVNIITTDAVTGKVTLRLKNVPWDQALDIILNSKSLGKTEMGNVWSIDLQANIDARERTRLAAQKEIKELEPVRTEFVQVNYSKAATLVGLLKKQGEHSFLSSRGNVSVDERTNTLIVQDTADKLEEVRSLVTSLDRPVRQVLIESRVVIASDAFLKDLGVRFGQSTNARISGEPGSGIITGGSFTKSGVLEGTGTAISVGGKESLMVDLPASTPDAAALGMAIGKIGTYLLQLELTALQQNGEGEIISSPRVITANQRKATIKQGVEIPYYPRVAAGGIATVQFKEAMLQLDVTPQITPDDRVIMDLHVTKNNERVSGTEYLIDKREVETQVLVDNGETVVLGGVFERTVDKSVRRVPFFGDLPIVGGLFRSTLRKDDKRELLIFVTPKILADKAATD